MTSRTFGEDPRPSGIASGELEILPDEFGFVRLRGEASRDVYVPPSKIREHALRTGDQIKCRCREPIIGERYRSAVQILEVNGRPTCQSA